MSFFAEGMKALVEAIRTTREARAETLTNLRSDTAQIRKETRQIVQRFSRENQAVAAAQALALRKDAQARAREVRLLLQQIRQQRQITGSRLLRDLTDTRAKRSAHVADLRQETVEMLQQTAADLKLAAKTWRSLAR